jgi:membrane-associated phospholipid phosphatase
VYLGAHWPADVVGGVLAGVACSAFWLRALLRLPDLG